ncbi:hypothetical protein QRD40_10965 [Comamonas sp. Y6]|uniref:Uncharacterized protein n=1 Tax=Comamonas resistens TaxID=3046670 RepID=A0ABY8SVY1_9BURK|nr:hypothetical protein [Comamonas resistens]MDL5036867.1 hypothetical protein [Comamonas resistens]WHS67177.1 hypothetical protein QMY55_08680 [Comamonas resistens]
MAKLSSYSVGDPVEEKPGLWFVVIRASEKEYRQYFDVTGTTVQSFYDSPELQELFASSTLFSYSDAVGKAYKILQDHIAEPGAPAYSFAYGVASQLIRRQFEQAATQKD